jgi:hypothetical protein
MQGRTAKGHNAGNLAFGEKRSLILSLTLAFPHFSFEGTVAKEGLGMAKKIIIYGKMG